MFEWTEECERASVESKKLFLSSNVLAHFDPSRETIVYVDASPVGVGCVMNQVLLVDGKRVEKPVLFALAALNERLQRYSQLDLSLIHI